MYSLETEDGAEWTDWFIPAGPDGFSKWYLNWIAGTKRMRHEKWFALIGTYDRKEPFLIGSGITQLKAQKTGELVCFANDVRVLYWNNKGSIKLTITKIA